MTSAACRLFRSAVVMVGLIPAAVCGQDITEPQGYRTENYRAPTPNTLKGTRVVSTAEAEQIWRGGAAVFIDVLPYAPRPGNLPSGTIWRDKPRWNIPGSTWLPDVGYAALAPVTESYLRTNLARLSQGDFAKMLVVYCLRSCWMSWNAAKRMLAMGYANIVWYPDGTDGWEEANLPLQESRPEPQLPQY